MSERKERKKMGRSRNSKSEREKGKREEVETAKWVRQRRGKGGKRIRYIKVKERREI